MASARYPGDEVTTSAYWTGNEIYDDNNNVINRSFSFVHGISLQELCLDGNGNIIEDYYIKMTPTLFHEMSHQLGAIDHYHEPEDPNDPDSPCKHNDEIKQQCSTCGKKARPTFCLMNDTWADNLTSRSSDSIFCDECKQEIMDYLRYCY